MNFLKIQGKQVKKFKIFTTNSNHNEKVAPDLLKRNFKSDGINKVWVSDVTCLKQLNGWIYLCVIIDLYSRKVVGWKVSEKNDESLILSTIEQALEARNPSKGMIFHSDRGSNYCSKAVRNLLRINGIRRSNSRKGNCWDNAVAESFFGSFKRELDINYFYDINDAYNLIFDHIEIFYNRQRTHSFLGYKTPDEFEILVA
jgi:transposase InsO family protein